jgi:hypothetical protein
MTVDREIDILCAAAERGWAGVDKVSNVLWTRQEMADAARAGCSPDEDNLGPAAGGGAVIGPFPGCPQQWGKSADFSRYRLLGETRHFAVFLPPGAEGGAGPGGPP